MLQAHPIQKEGGERGNEMPAKRQKRQQQRQKHFKKPRKRQRGRGVAGLLTAASVGVDLGRSKKYRRMGVTGAKGHYRRRYAPWEV